MFLTIFYIDKWISRRYHNHNVSFWEGTFSEDLRNQAMKSYLNTKTTEFFRYFFSFGFYFSGLFFRAKESELSNVKID